tara:strand:- start:87 stop:338 length:252 start_codon:yes stop_codon:yes gene_type:complete
VEAAYKRIKMGKNKAVNVQVTLKETRGNSARLIKRFIKKVKKLRILDDLRERRYYEKPSSKRRRLKKQKKKNARKAAEDRKTN